MPKEFTAFMLMGGGEIDLRDARFAEREVSIHIVAILGGCEVIVPEDATVYVTGIGILGAFEHTDAGAGSPDGPVITINGVALMGGVDVKRKPTLETSREARQQRLDARRDRLEARHSTTRTGTSTTRTGATAGEPANWTNAAATGARPETGFAPGLISAAEPGVWPPLEVMVGGAVSRGRSG